VKDLAVLLVVKNVNISVIASSRPLISYDNEGLGLENSAEPYK
jgi:hypothetical protein